MTPAPVKEAEMLALRAFAGEALFPASAVAVLDKTGVTAADFSDRKTQALFVALDETVRAGQSPEIVSLLARIGHSVPREMITDVLMNQEICVADQRLTAVREAGRRRRLVDQLHELQTIASNTSIALEVACGEAHRILSTLDGGGDTLHAADADLHGLMDRIDAVQRGVSEPVLSTGIHALDFFVALRRNLVVIASMPGVGKSALIAGIARNLILRSVKVGVISLEDEREWLLRRLVADAARVPLFVIGARPMSTEQLAHVNEAAESIYGALQHLLMEDRPAMTTAEVVATARRMVAAGCKAIFVDHLGEIRLERSDRHDLDIMEALQTLRALAKTYQVPIIVACHLKRRQGLEVTTPPTITDFAFSAAVERMARIALGLYRSESGNIGCVVLKQTEGPPGFDFELNFSKLFGIVDDTPVTTRMREALSWVAP